ncbi:putative glycoside hydrolase [Acetivibrio cellulolyticus]|uniref:putative glycoside hydrolase n=1 Tax=Acetivibrio cellulolyticus TaxID=35830 RepID=UPI0001E2D885|nr:putative glycoside hydrolase [Acetivibrio cellulolyticus]
MLKNWATNVICMRNKMVLLLLVGAMVFSMTSCTNKKTKTENSPIPTVTSGNKTPNSTGNTGNGEATSMPNASASPAVGSQSNADGINSPKKDIKVKALYLTGWTVGNPAKVQHYIDLANNTEINSYVVDIKDDDGYVGYESNVPAVKEAGAWKPKYKVDEVLKAFHDKDVHVIGRLVCFKDPVYSAKNPDLAIKKTDGTIWKEKLGNGKTVSWLNPYNKESWEYLVSIAKEAVEKGFDEIQFDYVRFPNGIKKVTDFSSYNKQKYEAIDEFLAYAKKELPGVVVSADVFAIICESPADTEGIGQYLEMVGKDVDYLSPMAYPSHYAPGQQVNGVTFAKPDLDPYGVVYNTLAKAKNRISKVQGYNASIRAYLQDFTASWLKKGNYKQYGPDEVKQQIKAVYDAGYEEWILWDPANSYDESAFLKEDAKAQ